MPNPTKDRKNGGDFINAFVILRALLWLRVFVLLFPFRPALLFYSAMVVEMHLASVRLAAQQALRKLGCLIKRDLGRHPSFREDPPLLQSI